MNNVQTVQNIYAAFGRGDVAAIVENLHANIEWDHGISGGNVPWLQPLTGHSAIPGFFEALGAVEFKKFEPRTLLEGDGVVVALIDIAFVVKENGRTVEENEEVHVWHFDDAGLVTRFNHKVDTHKHWVAWRGE